MHAIVTPLDIFAGPFFNNVDVFLITSIIIGAIIGALSKNFSIAVFGGFLIFIEIAMAVDRFIFNSVLYVIIALILLVFGLKFFSFSTQGGDGV